jgi:hypothetical protein
MSKNEQNNVSQRSSINSQIGWLSLCIIAAAWGNRLLPDEAWADAWGIIGVFGLASALGLASVALARKAHLRRLRRTAVPAGARHPAP